MVLRLQQPPKDPDRVEIGQASGGRPRLTPEPQSVVLNIRLRPSVLDEFERQARLRGRSVTAAARRLIELSIGADPTPMKHPPIPEP